MERTLRGIAGALILITVFLAYYVHYQWIWFTVFIGFNLLQSAFTGWCPMMTILKKMGLN